MKKNAYVDDSGNNFEMYLNADNELFIEVGSDDYPTGWITLNKEDVKQLIKDLKLLYTEM